MSPSGADEFERLYDAYYQPLCRFAFSFVRLADIAQELVSDVFANVWMHWDRWPPAIGEGPYLYRAVRNRLQNHVRNTRRRAGHLDDLRESDEVGMGAPHELPDVVTETNDTMQRVWAAVASLSPKARDVLTLHWQHQLSLSEVAEVLEMSEVAVRVQHSRALRQLRERLGDLFA